MLPSGSEFLLIILVAFMLFGGKRLGEFARTMGKMMRELKKASRDFQREINLDKLMEEEDKDKPDLKG